MERVITGNGLIKPGYSSGPMIGQMLERGAEHEAKGVTDKKYLIKILKREFKAPPPKMVIRENPVELADVVAEIRPLGCIIAGESGVPFWKKRKEEELTPKQKRQHQHRADRRRNKQDLNREW